MKSQEAVSQFCLPHGQQWPGGAQAVGPAREGRSPVEQSPPTAMSMAPWGFQAQTLGARLQVQSSQDYPA